MARGVRRGLHMDHGSLDRVMARIQNIADKHNEKARYHLEKGAEEIMSLASMYAPYKTGLLGSEGFEISKEQTGRNRRNIYSVTLADGVPYGIYMHESTYNLGPRSIEKARIYGLGTVPSATGKFVGRKFLERAAQKMEPEIRRDVFDAIKGLL